MTQGRVEKAFGQTLVSKGTNREGAFRRVTIATYAVKEGKKTTEKEKSVIFNLLDFQDSPILVQSVEYTRGLRQLLQEVCETRSVDKSDNMVRTKEYLLLFGTHLVGYGEAYLGKFPEARYAAEMREPQLVWKSQLRFVPYEVSTNVEKLSYPNKTWDNALKCFSMTLICAGARVIIFSGVSLIVMLVRFCKKRSRVESKNPTTNPT